MSLRDGNIDDLKVVVFEGGVGESESKGEEWLYIIGLEVTVGKERERNELLSLEQRVELRERLTDNLNGEEEDELLATDPRKILKKISHQVEAPRCILKEERRMSESSELRREQGDPTHR